MGKHIGKEILYTYLDTINKIIDGFGYVVSIKILCPSDVSLTSLTPLLVLSDVELKSSYNILDEEFVDRDNKFYSLTFLKYNDAVKYDVIESYSIASNSKPSYKFFQENIIPIDDNKKLEELRNLNNEECWKRWLIHIKKYFPIGKSTLWSYAILRRQDKEIISSAYLIFSADITEQKAIIINKICQDLLYEFIMELYVTELKRSEFEKEQLAREQMLYVGMGHYIKNSMKGLEEHEIEIINYLKTKCSENDRIVLTAQLQRLIYSLIELYLQMRQIAISGTLNTKMLETTVQIKLCDLINLIYLHSIIVRGRFYMALEKPEMFEVVKKTVIKQIENISNLTDILRNDSFNQTDIHNILSNKGEIEHFHYLSRSGFVYTIKIDDSLKQLSLNLNSIQFKYLYTVFTEIFDNCFSNKHSTGSRVAYLYLDEDKNEDYKNVIVSSRDSSLYLDKKYKFQLNELCNNCFSTGNGIKIIQSALTNVYLESDLFFPVNSESKSIQITDRRSINIYEYNIYLNNKLFV